MPSLRRKIYFLEGGIVVIACLTQVTDDVAKK